MLFRYVAECNYDVRAEKNFVPGEVYSYKHTSTAPSVVPNASFKIK